MNKLVVSFIFCTCVVMTPSRAEIATDGTVGPAVNLPGPNFNIGQNLGALRGNNLFHSFSQFNINSSESALFTGSNQIQNVISRVTGGTPSNINGVLTSQIGSAAFYLINPAGIVFGQNAQVDVPGAFYASTAQELKFTDGTKFSAVQRLGSTLSMTAPAAFGFLGEQTGTIAVNGANLEFKPGASVQLNAAGITIDKVKLSGEGIDLQLAAVGDRQQDVAIAELPNHALAGSLTLNDAELDVSGNGKGRVAVRAGDMKAVNSGVFSANTGATNIPANQGIDMKVGNLKLDNVTLATGAFAEGNAGSVQISAEKGLAVVNGSQIASLTFAEGHAGTVNINAGNIQVDNQSSKRGTGIASQAFPGSSGNAGMVNVNAQKEIAIVNGGQISSSSFGKGSGGTVSVAAETIRINNQNSGTATGIFSNADKDSRGNAGVVKVRAQKTLSVVNGGEISSSTFGTGNAGKVSVSAGAVLVDNQNSVRATGIVSQADKDSSGHAGTVEVNAQQELTVVNGGQIASATFGKGNGGTVSVNAEKILVDNQNSNTVTAISSQAEKDSSGHAGTVIVNAQKELSVVNGGQIVSSTFGKGNAGTVSVQAETIRIDNQNSNKGTNIASQAGKGSTGNAGTVSVNALKELAVVNGGEIDSSTFGKGNAGTVNVNAENILVDKQGSNRATGIGSQAGVGSTGNGGNVNVTAKRELTLRNNGFISSDTFGNGNAGTVTVNAETINIKGKTNSKFITGISSSSGNEASGNPGTVMVNATKSISMNTGDIKISSGKVSNNPINTNAKLSVTTPQLTLSNDSQISAEAGGSLAANLIEINTSKLSLNNSSITTNASQGNGGPITINAKDWALLKNGRITTSVGELNAGFGTTTGNGGDIAINTPVLVMDTGFIQANTNANNASGGDININVEQLVASGGNLQTGGTEPLTFKPDSGINVIQAAAPNGINGNIANTAPQLNIVGTLVGLNTPQLDLNRIGHDPCSNTVMQSTLKNQGKGGLPHFHKGQDGYTIDRLFTRQRPRKLQTAHASIASPGNQGCQPKTGHHPLQ